LRLGQTANVGNISPITQGIIKSSNTFSRFDRPLFDGVVTTARKQPLATEGDRSYTILMTAECLETAFGADLPLFDGVITTTRIQPPATDGDRSYPSFIQPRSTINNRSSLTLTHSTTIDHKQSIASPIPS
jgi:hypothetical protein